MYEKPILIGKSPQINELKKFIIRASKTDVNVLLLGETGVGKNVVAQRIHLSSDRENNLFIKFNCANLNENLLESELFGYKRGAFTGAFIDKSGLLEEANGGTFFLDEIADIPPNIQAKFLTVIEDKIIRRLGDNKTRNLDVRFILATNKNILSLVRKAKFRKDLYYRINILSFHIAPLRERKEDIPLLINSYLNNKNFNKSRNFTIARAALDKLMRYSFPGNVRELENILERAIIISDRGIIRQRNISFCIVSDSVNGKNTKCNREIIIKAVEKYQGNKTRTARALGISRQWIHKVLKESKKDANDRLS